MQDNTPKLEKVVMEEQLDLVLKDMKKAAEREALLRAELKRSREEIEEMSTVIIPLAAHDILRFKDRIIAEILSRNH